LKIAYRFDDPELRHLLSRPLSTVVSLYEAVELSSKAEQAFSVGDVVSRSLLERGMRPHVVIYDEKTHRSVCEPFPSDLLRGYSLYTAENPAGVITEEAYSLLKRLISRSEDSAVKILGEEDLLGLVVIDLAPVNSAVLYGQPGRGIVLVRVDERYKSMVRSILQRAEVV